MNYLIYTLHIEEMDMNEKSNISLIYKGVSFRRRR